MVILLWSDQKEFITISSNRPNPIDFIYLPTYIMRSFLVSE